jgi:RNA recognition motif-containing protein
LQSGPFSVNQIGEKTLQKKLFVGGLSYNTDVEEIRELFAQAGEVLSANIIRDKFTNQSRGFGFVEMATEEQAVEAIKRFNGTSLGGRTLVVNESRPQVKRGPGGGNGRDGGFRRREPRW